MLSFDNLTRQAIAWIVCWCKGLKASVQMANPSKVIICHLIICCLNPRLGTLKVFAEQRPSWATYDTQRLGKVRGQVLVQMTGVKKLLVTMRVSSIAMSHTFAWRSCVSPVLRFVWLLPFSERGMEVKETEVLAIYQPLPVTVYSVSNCRPHLSHFW